MPSHLHPRSRYTTSLFGTTLLVSFLVVGIPHILPCPAPRVQFADVEEVEEFIGEDGQRRRRRRRMKVPVVAESNNDEINEREVDARRDGSLRGLSEEERILLKRGHECPVPKPRTLLEGILGVKPALGEKEKRQGLPVPKVVKPVENNDR